MKFSKGVWACGLAFALCCGCAAPVLADDAAEADRQWRAGDLAGALAHADAFLQQHPRDAQIRFLRAVLLSEQNRADEAIAAYSKLIEDFPALPEPYNNLAVLLMASGQYDKARSAFETATRIQPKYASAHENLGNIYAKMAMRAYGKALQADPASAGAKLKVSTLYALIENSSGDISRQLAGATAPAGGAEGNRDTLPAAPPTAAFDANDVAEYNAVMNVLENWAKAWNARDVDAYLSFYGGNFQTPDGEPRKKWEQKRRSRILGRSYINVKIDLQQVMIKDGGATVKFRQIYTSDRFTDDSIKTLMFLKQGGQWHIVQEYAGG